MCRLSTRGSVDFPPVTETLTLAKMLGGGWRGEKEKEKGGKTSREQIALSSLYQKPSCEMELATSQQTLCYAFKPAICHETQPWTVS